MPKSLPVRPSGVDPAPRATPLDAGVRRHLAQNLRSLYADTLAAPVSQRLEALLAQLDKTKR